MTPSLNELKEIYHLYDGFVFYKEIAGDIINPIMLLSRIDKEYIFFLESATVDNKILARYSFFGYNPESVIEYRNKRYYINGNESRIEKDIFFEIKNSMKRKIFKNNLGDFCGGYVGFLSYESVNYMGVLRRNIRESDFPIFMFMKVNRFFTYDNYTGRLYACLYINKEGLSKEELYEKAESIIDEMIIDLFSKKEIFYEKTSSVFEKREDLTSDEYVEVVKNIKREIEEGEAIQVVISKKYEIEFEYLNPISFYRALRNINPSPYMFYMKFKDIILLGSSPETHLKIKNGVAYIKPIAGTYPIHRESLEEDKQRLINDPKEVSEHLMLLDLARNDLYTKCDINSVEVEKSFSPEEYSHVIHLVSSVKGSINSNTFDLFEMTFPAGTVSGAPKVRAIELIDEYEVSNRGFYAGCVGYFGYNGDLDTCITIRSALINNNRITFRAGAGIVYDSDPVKESLEVENKLRAMFKAIEMIKSLEERNVFARR